MPAIHFMRRRRSGADPFPSPLIALLRGLAALQVAAAHLRAETFPSLRALAEPPLAYVGLAFITGFAHQAVIVFFLISGALVGGSLLDKIGQPLALQSYAIDRVSRLWTVLLPTFLLMLVLGVVQGELVAPSFDFALANDYSFTSLVGNLFGLQTVTMANFGGNYALWSLANESWYYLMFPLLLLGLGRSGRRRRGLALLLLAMAAALLPTMLQLYFLIWLLGAASSRLRIDCTALERVALLLLLVVVSVSLRLTGNNDDMVPGSFWQDVLFSLIFLSCLASIPLKISDRPALLSRLAALAAWLSEFSFTLYVIHVPLIGLLRHTGLRLAGRSTLSPDAPADYAIFLAALFAIVSAAYLSYRLFEAHTPMIRRWLKARLLHGQPRSPLHTGATVHTSHGADRPDTT